MMVTATEEIIIKIRADIKEATKSFGKFRMELLGIMFAGLQLKRTTERIASSTIKTFNEVISSVRGATSNVSMLSAHFEFLKFTIGDAINTALLPLMPLLFDLIDGFAAWVNEHPKLTFGIIGLGIAIGGLMFIFGALGLAINSIVIFFQGPLGAVVLGGMALAWKGIAAAIAFIL